MYSSLQKVTSLVVILGNHDHRSILSYRRAYNSRSSRFKNHKGCFRKGTAAMSLIPSYLSRPARPPPQQSYQIRWPSRCSIPLSLPVQFYYHSSHSSPTICASIRGSFPNPCRNTFLTVSRESHCLIVFLFPCYLLFFVLHISIQTERYFLFRRLFRRSGSRKGLP